MSKTRRTNVQRCQDDLIAGYRKHLDREIWDKREAELERQAAMRRGKEEE